MYNKLSQNSGLKTMITYSSNVCGLAGLGSAQLNTFFRLLGLGDSSCHCNSVGWLELLCSIYFIFSWTPRTAKASFNHCDDQETKGQSETCTASLILCSEQANYHFRFMLFVKSSHMTKPEVKGWASPFVNYKATKRMWIQEHVDNWDQWHNLPKNK